MPAIFNGTNHLQRSNSDVCPSGNFTVCLWVKTSETIIGNRVFLSMGNSSNTTDYTSFRFREDDSSRVLVQSHASGETAIKAYGPVANDGYWYPIIARRVGRTYRFSIAGQKDRDQGGSPWEATIGGTTSLATDILALGTVVRTTVATTTYFTGEVAEVAIFNNALTEEQYIEYFQDGFPVKGVFPSGVATENLLAYYPLDDVNALNDVSGNGRHLTNNGSVTFDAGTELYITKNDLPNITSSTPLIIPSADLDTSTTHEVEVAGVADRQINVMAAWNLASVPSTIKTRSYGYLFPYDNINSGNLANKETDYVTHPKNRFSYLSRNVIKVEAAGNDIHGVEIGVGDDISGGWESQGTATHCRPLETKHTDGNVYRVHTDTDFNVWLSKNHEPFLIKTPLIDSPTTNVNERYHCGACIVSVPDTGIVVFQTMHGNYPPAMVVIPDSDLITMTDETTRPTRVVLGSVNSTYCHATVTSDGTVLMSTRDPFGNGLLYKIADPFGAQTITEIYLGLLNYLRYMKTHTSTQGSKEYVVFGHHNRPAGTYGKTCTAFIYDPSNDNAYSFNGFQATGAGTSGDQLWSNTERDTDTHVGNGIQVVPITQTDAVDDQKYSVDTMLADLRELDTTTHLGGRVFVPVITRSTVNVADPKNDYQDGSWELYRHFGYAFDKVVAPDWMVDTNTHRLSMGITYQNQGLPTGGGDVAVGVLCSRGKRLGNGMFDEQPFTLYYDWGGQKVLTFEITDLWGSGVEFKLVDSLPGGNNYPAGFITPSDNKINTFVVQGAADVALSEHHRQLIPQSVVVDTCQSSLKAANILLDTIVTTLGTAGSGLTDLGGMSTSMKNEVNSEVLDVLFTDTFGEPISFPPETTSVIEKINWLYTLSRNKSTATDTLWTVRNDADTADIATAVVSDDGIVFIRDKGS